MHHVSQIGGASYCLLSIIKSLNRNIIKPLVLLKEQGPLTKELKNLDVEVLYLPKMVATPYNIPIYKFSSIRRYLALRRALKDFRKLLNARNDIDAVYCNNLMLSDYLRVSKEHGLRTFIHIREHWPLDEHVFQLKHIQKNLKLADQVIAINRYSASIAKNVHSEIVYDWIDLDSRYESVDMNKLFGEDIGSRKVMLYTGGLNYIKGPLYIAKGFTECLPGDEYRLLMLGDYNLKGINGVKKHIKYFLTLLGFPSYSNKVISAIRADYRIKTIPSTYFLKDILQKSYCNLSYFMIPHANLAQAECILAGIPTICAETDESLEYSLEGKLSYTFKLGNYNNFCHTLKNFEKDYANKKKLILQKSSEISKMFNKEANVGKLNYIIEKVLCDN